jgi:hypothetical protein
MAKVCPLIYVTSKRARVMSFGYQLALEKLITHANTSCPLFDIHKSKLIVIKWHFPKVDKNTIV